MVFVANDNRRNNIFGVPKFIDNRLMQIQSYRVFDPVCELLAKHGLVKPSSLKELTERESLPQLKDAISKFVRLNTRQKPLNKRLLKASYKMALKDLFPNGLPQLKPLADVETLKQRTNWRANCGFPYFTKKGDLVDRFSDLFSTFAKGYDLETLKQLGAHPAVMWSRVQLKSAEKLSIRAIYGEPGLYVGCESRFTTPIVEWFSANFDTAAYVIGVRQPHISALALGMKDDHKYCLDYSAFDLTVHPDLVVAAFDIVKLLYRDEDPECLQYIDYIAKRFSDGENYHPLIGTVARVRGLPSGSAFTNIIGTFINIIALRMVFIKMGLNWAVRKIIAHGDDSVVAMKVRVSIARIAKLIAEFGMEMNVSKSSYFLRGENTLDFLGSKWVNGLPERSFEVMAIKASIVSGKPVILPRIDDIIKARIYTMFGFDHRLPKFWEDLGFGVLEGQRVYLLNDGLSWDQGLLNRSQGKTGDWVIAPKEPWRMR